MKLVTYGDDSSIAAFATTPGSGALTLIRCSGEKTIEFISSVFTPVKIKDAPGNTVIHGWIISGGEKIDEVLVSVFRKPKSYTGEDSVDICCHGGSIAGKAVLEVLKSAGFRDALPGEFTFRAFMNGKLDLTRCESVMELVSAKTDTSRRHAVMRLCGSLETEINDIKKLLVQVLSSAEIYLDYSEDEISGEPDAGISKDEIAGRLPDKNNALSALIRLKKLASSWQLERLYQEGVTVVIAGRPNAGKSSLFNALLREDRSIVTAIPGTTRDWIEAWVSIQGIPVRLIDTAGLREETADSIEKIGVQRSHKLLQEAQIILYLIDGITGITDEDREFFTGYQAGIITQQFFFLWSKSDVCPLPPLDRLEAAGVFSSNNLFGISAKTGKGMEKISSLIVPVIHGQAEIRQAGAAELQLADTLSAAAVGTMRQKNLVDNACSLLEEALALAEQEEPLDIIAPLLREAVNALGEITGEVSTADILEEMFSRFCVGK